MVSLTKRTVPLPLEIVFRVGIGGTYNTARQIPIEDGELTARFEFEPGGGSDGRIKDAWEMREEFLVKEENEDDGIPGVVGMSLAFGRFGVGREDLSVPLKKLGKRYSAFEAKRLLEADYSEWRSLVCAAMGTKMNDWPKLKRKFPADKVNLLCQPMRLTVEWENGWPNGIIKCSGILQAVIATLQVDALLNAEYRSCACIGCGKRFKVTRKDQRYCPDSNCKHRQVVRNARSRKRKAVKLSTDGGAEK
jgi:hypothetical protein